MRPGTDTIMQYYFKVSTIIAIVNRSGVPGPQLLINQNSVLLYKAI